MIARLTGTRLFLFLFTVAYLLSGCSTLHKTVDVPAPVPCVEEKAVPVWADNALAIRSAANIEARTRLLLAGRIQRDKWIDEAVAQFKACSSLPPL